METRKLGRRKMDASGRWRDRYYIRNGHKARFVSHVLTYIGVYVRKLSHHEGVLVHTEHRRAGR